jgi:hypothetical protein
MTADNTVETRCKSIYSELSPLLSWKWDSRFRVILAEFSVNDSDKVSAALSRGFESSWDGNTIKSAPPQVKKILDILCGMQSEQRLFTFVPDTNTVLFAAWWPWGNKEKVSVRIGICYHDKIVMPQTELEASFRNWFDIK